MLCYQTKAKLPVCYFDFQKDYRGREDKFFQLNNDNNNNDNNTDNDNNKNDNNND